MYYDDPSLEMLGAILIFYVFFLGIWWILAGVMSHAMLSKKGYRHVGLYILAWFPMLNWFTLFLCMGLPDALMHKKMDYLLRQLAASGYIAAPSAPAAPGVQYNQQAAYTPPTAPQQAQPAQGTSPAQPMQPNQLFGTQQNPTGGNQSNPSGFNNPA